MNLTKKVSIMIRIPSELKDELKLRCCKEKIAMTQLVIKLLKEYLEKNTSL